MSEAVLITANIMVVVISFLLGSACTYIKMNQDRLRVMEKADEWQPMTTPALLVQEQMFPEHDKL